MLTECGVNWTTSGSPMERKAAGNQLGEYRVIVVLCEELVVGFSSMPADGKARLSSGVAQRDIRQASDLERPASPRGKGPSSTCNGNQLQANWLEVDARLDAPKKRLQGFKAPRREETSRCLQLPPLATLIPYPLNHCYFVPAQPTFNLQPPTSGPKKTTSTSVASA
jgi:hypothetical protein